ncbi:hypothetical protein CFIMG_003326RA [Ceratocystis fimbriata CBS 114723]|uniref:3'-5' exonuclease domain-containing protein n=1 Tax=Ceratocystis fimbriata CBS 114723 TaxID=1035309 RepID=A0A2C5X8P4_9PEZI|nr:hypothetical protein CFIMG_003326RA [Ceratocystis fimbriata CBS 114723]
MPASTPIYRGWTPDRGIRFASSSRSLTSSTSGQEVDSSIIASYCLPTSETESVADGNKDHLSCQELLSPSQPGDTVRETARTIPSDASSHAAPVSSLPFNIPEDIFLQAKNAPHLSEGSYWSYSLYRGPLSTDGEPRKVNVHYCRSRHTMDRVVKNYFLDEPVIGLDLEWVAESSRYDGVRKNISLIQIASPSRIALFHVALFNDADDDLASPSLRSILEDDNVIKCGVAIKADSTRLRTYMNIDVKGVLELSNLYKVVKYVPTGEYNLINRKLVRLADQVEEHLKLPLFKGEVRTGDWSEPLTMPQIIYSASDAYAGLQLYQIYEDKRLAMSPVPPRPHFAECGLPIPLPDGAVVKKVKRSRKASATAVKYAIATEASDSAAENTTSTTPKMVLHAEAGEDFVVTQVEAMMHKPSEGTLEHRELPTEDGVETAASLYNPVETLQDEIQEQEQEEVEQLRENVSNDKPIIEDKDVNLEALSMVFDINKLAEALKDSVKFEVDEEPRVTFDENRRQGIIDQATEFAKKYRDEHDPEFRLPFLRAYYLWHHQGFRPDEAAKILREPPLANVTICSYIMEAIRTGNLTYDKQRLSKEVVIGLSAWHRHVRYKSILPPEVVDLDKEGFRMKGLVLRRALERAMKMLPPEDKQLENMSSSEAMPLTKAEAKPTTSGQQKKQPVELAETQILEELFESFCEEEPFPKDLEMPVELMGSEDKPREYEANEADLVPGNMAFMDEYSHLYVDEIPEPLTLEQGGGEQKEQEASQDEKNRAEAKKATATSSNAKETDFIYYSHIRPME